MKTLNLNDKIVLGILLLNHCVSGFDKIKMDQELKDGYRISDFVTVEKGIVVVKGENISYSADYRNLNAVINFYGKKIEIYAFKFQLDLANKIADTIEAQCTLADIECPKMKNLSYVFA